MCPHPSPELMEGGASVADAIGLLWFKRRLPAYATRFIEMCVVLCADHGPCVSGVCEVGWVCGWGVRVGGGTRERLLPDCVGL